jgi:hypothetical protein
MQNPMKPTPRDVYRAFTEDINTRRGGHQGQPNVTVVRQAQAVAKRSIELPPVKPVKSWWVLFIDTLFEMR